MQTLNVVVVGLGHQAWEDHLPAVVNSKIFNLVGVCDIDEKMVNKAIEQYRVPGFTTVEAMLDKVNPKVAIVAVPHDRYLPLLEQLAERGIHIIKEKPLATTLEEAIKFQKIIDQHKVFFGIITQRRFNPIFQWFVNLLPMIGDIAFIQAEYSLNIAQLDEGWRASKKTAGGGALLDMGYHPVDLLVWGLGLPNKVTGIITRGGRPDQIYDVEDTAVVTFGYDLRGNPEVDAVGTMLITRVGKKNELYVIRGTEGLIELRRGLLTHFNKEGVLVHKLEREFGWPAAMQLQLEHFAKQINQQEGYRLHEEHWQHIAFIEAGYRSAETGKTINPAELLKERGLATQKKDA